MRYVWAAIAAGLACLAAAALSVLPAERGGAPPEAPVGRPPALSDPAGAVQRFAQALTYPTVAGRADADQAFAGLHAHLAAAFPAAFAALEVRRVPPWSLLLRWQGSDAALAPGLCISHLDVVPAGDAAACTHPPFSGAVRDGCRPAPGPRPRPLRARRAGARRSGAARRRYVWGRGAIDVKFGVTALLEAASELLARGCGPAPALHRARARARRAPDGAARRARFAPARTLLLAFGDDEETGGAGARATAALLEANGTELEWILDEGGPVLVVRRTPAWRCCVPGRSAAPVRAGAARLSRTPCTVSVELGCMMLGAWVGAVHGGRQAGAIARGARTACGPSWRTAWRWRWSARPRRRAPRTHTRMRGAPGASASDASRPHPPGPPTPSADAPLMRGSCPAARIRIG